MNVYLHIINANLALKLIKLDLEFDSTNSLNLARKLELIIFLDLVEFTQNFALDFTLSNLLLLSTLSIIFILSSLASFTKGSIFIIFSIKISETTIWLKF